MSPQWPNKKVMKLKGYKRELTGNAGVIKSNGREYPLLDSDDFYEMQNEKVAIAFNWHLKLFSIRRKPKGKVIGYTKAIRLTWVSFDVDTEKALQVQAGGAKNLHAFVVGGIYAGDLEDTFDKWAHRLRYNPKQKPYFVALVENEWVPCAGATGVAMSVNEGGRPSMTAYIPELFKIARYSR